jgi:hypothetical protein
MECSHRSSAIMISTAHVPISLYHATTVHHKLRIPFSEILDFQTLEDDLTRRVSAQITGKCIPEGFVKPHSCKLRSHSVGALSAGNITFNLEVDCMMCLPHDGDVIQCVAKTVTQAGIRAHAFMEPSPVVIYISREMQESSPESRTMDSVKPGDGLLVKVIGKRFELNDKHVSVMGEWIAFAM